MDLFRKLQQDLAKGRLTESQFSEVLFRLDKRPKAKKIRPRKHTSQDHRRRTRLRLITKWVFDVELNCASTPLYLTQDETSLVLPVFFKLANQVIKYAESDPIVAASTHEELTDSIREIVKNRHKNLKDSKKSKKDGTPNIPLKTIYEKKRQLAITLKNGEQLMLKPPLPLPLPTVKVQSPPVKTQSTPSVDKVQAAKTATPPTTSKVMAMTQESDSSDSDFDMLEMMQNLQDLKARIKQKKQEKQQRKLQKQKQMLLRTMSSTVPQALNCRAGNDDGGAEVGCDSLVDNRRDDDCETEFEVSVADKKNQNKRQKQTQNQKQSWLHRMSATGGGQQTQILTCRNEDCGAEFDASLVDNQNGDPVLCQVCWDAAKEELKKITSATGAGSGKKRKATKKNIVPGVVKKKSKINRPATPVRNNKLQRTQTPPNPKFNKFHVGTTYPSTTR